MKPFKMLGLAALAALMAMAFVGASSAMAENTQLCTTDESPCEVENVVEHVHEVSTENASLLSSLGNVTCAVLFLSTEVGDAATPQYVEGNFTYTGCKRSSENCTVTEENGPVMISVLRIASETAAVTGEGEVKVKCGIFINCTFSSEGLEGEGRGALEGGNGTMTFTEQEVSKVSGAFCPETAKLDITTETLSETFIKGGGGTIYCVEYQHAHGLYSDNRCRNRLWWFQGRSGQYELVRGVAGRRAGDPVCAQYRSTRKFLYSNAACTTDDSNNRSLYERGRVLP